MNNSPSLYLMELKKNRTFFITVLALQFLFLAAWLTVKITQIVNGNSLDPYNILPISELLIKVTFITFPLMLLYSWHREERGETSYQMLSFPVLPHKVLKNKLGAFLSIGVVWIVFFTVAMFVVGWLRGLLYSNPPIKYTAVANTYLHHFSNLLLHLGFMCLVISVMQVIKQRRLLAGTGILLAGVAVYLLLRNHYSSFLHSLYGKIAWVARTTADPHVRTMELIDAHREVMFLIRTAHLLLPLLVGIVCVYIGFYLFDKYSEI